jgi:hypothetical protein
MHMGSEYDDNLFRSDSSHEDTMGRITSRKIERPDPPPSIPPPKVKRFSVSAKTKKYLTLQPGESTIVGKDVLVRNAGDRRAEILIVAPGTVVVSEAETWDLAE